MESVEALRHFSIYQTTIHLTTGAHPTDFTRRLEREFLLVTSLGRLYRTHIPLLDMPGFYRLEHSL
jgi:hypothetical protein